MSDKQVPVVEIDPESSQGRVLRSLCFYKGASGAPRPIVIGRRKTRPEAPYQALVRRGLASVEIFHGIKMYSPTDAGRELCASWGLGEKR